MSESDEMTSSPGHWEVTNPIFFRTLGSTGIIPHPFGNKILSVVVQRIGGGFDDVRMQVQDWSSEEVVIGITLGLKYGMYNVGNGVDHNWPFKVVLWGFLKDVE